MIKSFLCLGYGYCAQALAPALQAQGWQVSGTTRSDEKAAVMRSDGVARVVWQQNTLCAAIERAQAILISAAPGEAGDPVLALCGDMLAQRAKALEWVGYLSTTGVYGDHKGGWVDETTPPAPVSERNSARVEAEAAWGELPGLPLHIFRLAGIYGPGRGPLESVRKGTARRLIKPGQVFSRVHVADIAQVLEASLKAPAPGRVYNVADDLPAAPQDVIAFAAELLGKPIPPDVPFETAQLTPMARSFYSQSRRVSNRRIREELGVRLHYPDYRSGLRAQAAAGVGTEPQALGTEPQALK